MVECQKYVKKYRFCFMLWIFKIFYNINTINLLDEIKSKSYNKKINDDQIRINNYILNENKIIKKISLVIYRN